MEINKVTVKNEQGLHLRPAAKIVQCAKKYRSKVVLCRGCKFADTCSIVDLLSLGATKDAELEIIANGPDEKEAVKELGEIFNQGEGI